MNKITIIGRLVADPELRQTGSGISVTSFTLAVDRPFKKGEDSVADFPDFVAWRNTAEFICKYFEKGSPMIVEGTLQTRMWEDKAGNKRKSTEIVVENVEFVPKAKGTNVEHESPNIEHGSFSAGSDADFMSINDDDLPW